MGNLEDDYTTSGKHYQIIEALDDQGNEIKIQLFDDPSIGMKIINGEFMVQFAKY
jgi:hypothetical protein